MLQLTINELLELTKDETFNDRFTITHNDIPLPVKGEKWHSSQYIEDDGRQYRSLEFTDNETGIEYQFPYVYHPDDENWFFDHDFNNIEVVEISVINPPKEEPPKEVKTETLSPEQQEVKDLWEQYYLIENEIQPFSESLNVSKDSINEVLTLMKGAFSYNQLILTILPICIEYKIEQESFWQFIQKKRNVWK